MSLPSQLGNGTDIGWTVPKEIEDRTDIDIIRVHRSSSENSNYTQIDEIAAKDGSDVYVKAYFDSSIGSARDQFYLVTFVSTGSGTESMFHITFFAPLPREARLIEFVRRSMPAVIQAQMTNEDYLSGLIIAIQIFNTYPPQTAFSLQNFPRSHEYFLISLAQLTGLSSRFLPLSIRDFRYSEPGGVVMDIDRGAKINQALEIIARVYTQYLPLVKMDFASDLPVGLGTVQLPLSMGGTISRGILNILDIFTAVGR